MGPSLTEGLWHYFLNITEPFLCFSLQALFPSREKGSFPNSGTNPSLSCFQFVTSVLSGNPIPDVSGVARTIRVLLFPLPSLFIMFGSSLHATFLSLCQIWFLTISPWIHLCQTKLLENIPAPDMMHFQSISSTSYGTPLNLSTARPLSGEAMQGGSLNGRKRKQAGEESIFARSSNYVCRNMLLNVTG